jgi:hypothetical protein
MDNAALWLQFGIMALIGIIGIYYQRRAVRLMKPEEKRFAYWPLVFMVILAASSWIPYFLLPDDLPLWPDPKPYVRGYGVTVTADGRESCYVTADGDRFSRYRNHWRLAAACYFYDGVGDPLDVPQLQTSGAYDIRTGEMKLLAVWGAAFPQFLHDKHANELGHVLLMLPAGIDPGQFSTLRQAKGLGVKFVNGGVNSFAPR